jgi:uncharacterized protein CbrC (UPF0167 family)
MTKNTVLGGVSYLEAIEGLTQGGLPVQRSDVEILPSEMPGCIRAKVPRDALFDLLRTPGYNCCQEEVWQFCCGHPAAYLGEWKERDFTLRAPDGDGRRYFSQASIDGVDESYWGILDEIGGPYMFRCQVCGKLLGNYDMD